MEIAHGRQTTPIRLAKINNWHVSEGSAGLSPVQGRLLTSPWMDAGHTTVADDDHRREFCESQAGVFASGGLLAPDGTCSPIEWDLHRCERHAGVFIEQREQAVSPVTMRRNHPEHVLQHD